MAIKLARHTLISLVTLATGLFLGSALQIAFAWTVPSALPPNDNVATPINISATDQTKSGSITVSGGADYLQAAQFRDNDDTVYYLDPNLDSKLHYATFDNVNSLGAVNANRVVASNYAQAPIFYDNDNTSFYLDPNGYSRVNALNVAGEVIYSEDTILQLNPWGTGNILVGWGAGYPTNLWVDGDVCTTAGHCLNSPTSGFSCTIVSSWGWFATCPAGYYVTGGGCNGVGSGAPFTMASHPINASTWMGCCGNTLMPACGVPSTVYAVCCK